MTITSDNARGEEQALDADAECPEPDGEDIGGREGETPDVSSASQMGPPWAELRQQHGTT
ncbi:MAG TPA: hypothetical protein VFI46_08210 [Jiangellaceae bacterium]|nr:hypothetical protein [Jiangellaceae bacterium]